MSSDMEYRNRNVTAVLGPTNTGKTHLAIERMLGHETGLIGLPLRLLAREVYDKIAARIGADKVALITGEEKIKPESPRFWVSTVEAMPRDIDVDFLAIDEIQLAADPERGHVFTDRLLHARGKLETLLLGAGTMRDCIAELIPGANFISRPRLSKLTYAGEKKITRLPTRSAVVAFSANDVYAIAELMRRQRGGAAVVLGALSPRTRNAQVALYQSGDVDFLVATDAIGMGLNLDVNQVAFAATRKFDGQVHRELTAGELGQIAGRAGRHLNDGTFGVTGGIESISADMVERLESHNFEPVKTLQWRSRELDFGTLDRLRDSLRQSPREGRLMRARMSDDVIALETVVNDSDVVNAASSRAAVARLWDVCQIPDYRKISSQNHAELVGNVYKFVMGPDGHIPQDWFSKQVELADRTDGDIDTLSNRLSHIRTWTFVANRADWLQDPAHWQGRTREIEDRLSDALHECLTQRFVDRRTSALMKGMRDKDDMAVEIAADGSVQVEKHFVGRLKGFQFTPDPNAEGIHGKAARNAASHVLAKELGMRARRVAAAKADAFKLGRGGHILWRDEEIARLEKGDDVLKPLVVVLSDEHLSGPDKEKVQERLDAWITDVVAERLKPLVELSKADDVSGLARGIAFRMKENVGVLRREAVAEEIRTLDQTARGQLRKYGVRFGAFNIFFPTMLKPASVDLALALWTLHQPPVEGDATARPEPPRPGLTSVPANSAAPEAFYRVLGFHLCGPRAVRVDMLERLADLIRPLIAWKAKSGDDGGKAPKGATGDGGFTATPDMMSILGCSADELGNVLRALGFRLDRKAVVVATPTAAVDTVVPDAAAAAAVDATSEVAASVAAEALVEVAHVDATPKTAVEGADVTPMVAAPANGSVEPTFIEIWRPRRRHQSQGGQYQGATERRGHRPRKPHAAAQPATAAAATEGPTPAVGQPDDPGSRTSAQHRRRDSQDQRDKTERAPRKPDPAGKADDRTQAAGDRRREQRRPDQRDGKRRDRDERPATQFRASPARTAGPDPDSPFAALGLLKAQLEKTGKT